MAECSGRTGNAMQQLSWVVATAISESKINGRRVVAECGGGVDGEGAVASVESFITTRIRASIGLVVGGGSAIYAVRRRRHRQSDWRSSRRGNKIDACRFSLGGVGFRKQVCRLD